MLRFIRDAGPEIAIPPESMVLTDYGAVWEGGTWGAQALPAGARAGGGCASLPQRGLHVLRL